MLKTNKVKHEKLIANENKPNNFSSHFNDFFIVQTTKKIIFALELVFAETLGKPNDSDAVAPE